MCKRITVCLCHRTGAHAATGHGTSTASLFDGARARIQPMSHVALLVSAGHRGASDAHPCGPKATAPQWVSAAQKPSWVA
jgi:hypothetical protein